ncbi:OGG1, partial [Symbiodinium pilosum]
DPIETLFSFICSQNNNVSRICLLTDRLRARFGEVVCRLQPPPGSSAHQDCALQHVREFSARRTLHAWPRSSVLAKATERSLKDLGLGYRAAYISQAAKRLMQEDGRLLRWLSGMRTNPPKAVENATLPEETETEREHRLAIRRELCSLPGIGAKVADCVALFGLGVHGAVPVDVHVWRITVRDYEPSLREAKSLTPTVYEEVGDAFRRRFGAPFAGWAHSVLFGAELAAERLPKDLREDRLDSKHSMRAP